MDRDRRGNSRERPTHSREESRRGKDQRDAVDYPSRPSSRAGVHADYRSKDSDRGKDRDYDDDRYGSSSRRADDNDDRYGRRESRDGRDSRRDADYGPTRSGRDDDHRTSKGGGRELDYGVSSKQQGRAPGSSTGGAGPGLPPTSRAGRLVAQERQQATSSSGRPRATSPAGRERGDERDRLGTPGSAQKTRGVTPGASNPLLAELRKQAGQMFGTKGGGNAASDDEEEAGEIRSPGDADGEGAGNTRSNHGSPAVLAGRKRKHSPVTWAPGGARESSKLIKSDLGIPKHGLSILDRAQAEAEALRRLELLKESDYDPDAPAAMKSSPSFSDDPDGDSAPGPVSRRRHHDRSDSDHDMHDEPQARKPKASRWLQQDEEDDGDNRRPGDASPPASGIADMGRGQDGSASPGDHGEALPEIKTETDLGSEEGDTMSVPKEAVKKEVVLPTAARYSMRRECRDVFDFERIEKISEGTYGVVYKAREKSTGRIVALKKVKMERETEGFPITSVREINILLNFHHPNIVQVEEIVVSKRDPDQIYMVMEYMDHDLKSLMDDKRRFSQPFSAGQVKCLLQQLLDGMAFLHKNWVLHRDLKTSNVLYNGKGELKLCDFGMARQYGEPLGKYSTNIVTLWYRAPELLFGTKVYNTAVDMWSVGCIFAELLTGKPLLPGQGEMDQIDKMLQLLGTPTPEDWLGLEALPGYKRLNLKRLPSTLRQRFAATAGFGQGVSLTEAGFDLLSRMLAWDPEKRISAAEALQHRWFTEPPLPVHKVLMPTFAPRKAG